MRTAIIPLFLGLALCLQIPGCSLVLEVNDYRIAHPGEIEIDDSPKNICVVAPKSQSFNVLSTSFLPTQCVLYEEDTWPEMHPYSSELTLYRIKVMRDQCASKARTKEIFVVALKEAIEFSPGTGFDRAVPIYFITALSIAIPIFLGLVIILNRSSLLKE